MSKAWSKGSTRAWRRTRAGVLARDGYRCQVQLEGVCTGRATCVHHTLGRAVSGDDPRYLVASCNECNTAVGEPRKYEPTSRPMTRW